MVYWAVWVLIIDNRIIFAVFEPLFPLKAAMIVFAGVLPYSIITGLGLSTLLVGWRTRNPVGAVRRANMR
jgi:hypothetical protein